MRKDCINRELTLEWIVGTFMFLILLALGYFTIIVGSDNLFRRTYELDVYFQNVAGLREGDNVTVQGMPIGRVADLLLENDWVKVRCALNRELVLHEDYRVEVVETSVLGGRQLRIDTGSPDESRVPDDERLVGTPPIDLMAEAAVVVAELRRTLTEEGVLENVAEGIARLNRVAGRLDRGEGTVGALLAEDTVYRDLEKIASNLSEVSLRANSVVAGIERGEGTLGMLLTDDEIGRELGGVLENVNAVTAQLRAGEGTLGRLLRDDTIALHLASTLEDVGEISARVRAGEGTLGKLLAEDAEVYDDLAQIMASVRHVTERVEAGEGSLGKLLSDDALYRQVIALVDEIRATIDDFRESTPLTTFTSILFGAL